MPDPDRSRGEGVELVITGTVLHWRGPAPHHFVAVPWDDCEMLRELAPALSYGWGVIPVAARLGRTSFATSLFPLEGGYLVPLKLAVRSAEGIDVGDVVSIVLVLAAGR